MLDAVTWGARARSAAQDAPPQNAVIDPQREWVVAARAGNEQAILWLLQEYRPPLVRLLTGVLGDAAAAEDAAQDALLHALRHLHQLRDPAAFYPWLRRAAVRIALRQRPRAEAATETPAHFRPGPSAVVETRVLVAQILASLPAELRAVLVLREMEQLDYQEIAGLLDVPIGTVRSRLFAARARFRDAWLEMDR